MKSTGTRCAMLASALLGLVLAISAQTARAADTPVSAPSRIDLQARLEALAQRARPGLLGVTVLDLQRGTAWRVNADRAYPMMSVFKAPMAAAVLARADRGELSLEQRVVLNRADLRGGHSAIAEHFHGQHMTFTLRQLLVAAVSHSDNTAADALVRLAGGPTTVTDFLRTHGIGGMRVDLDEGGMAQVFEARGPARKPPANETSAQEHRRRQRGYAAFLADPRNRSTPDAAADFLRKLWRQELLSPASTRQLIGLMEAQTLPRRLRAGLPSGVRLADKCGTSYSLDGVTAAYNDIGILTWPDGRSVIVAAFLTAAHGSQAERDALFADLARATAEALHP